jgi:hypothetical protein
VFRGKLCQTTTVVQPDGAQRRMDNRHSNINFDLCVITIDSLLTFLTMALI